MELRAADILGPGGAIARRLPHYEQRPQQLEMAEAVTEAIGASRHLLVEAGTGVGKSFAYLVPVILAATEEQAPIRRVVISTHTISLQEQLLGKDLPLLNSVIPREFSSVLVKGRSNYISLRRRDLALKKASYLFPDLGQTDELRGLLNWSKETEDGSLSDLASRPSAAVWDEVASDANNCLSRQCHHYQKCFFYQARRRAQNAQILVVNHALFFSDLALRASGFGILPPYDVVVFDEAHTLESVASDHLGLRITSGQVDYNLRKLYHERLQKGLLADSDYRQGQELVRTCYAEADDFFAGLEDWWSNHPGTNGRISEPGLFRNHLSSRLGDLAGLLERYADQFHDESEKTDMAAAARRIDTLANSLNGWCRQDIDEAVYWVERSASRSGQLRFTLAAAPIDISGILHEHLFQKTRSVILTSATMSVGKSRGFDFLRSRLGITSAKTKQLGSPFNYRQQARIVLPQGIPDPTTDQPGFERRCGELIKHYLRQTDGHAFVLCTSYDLLRKLSSQLIGWLATENMALYSQADDIPRTQLLEKFQQNPRGVLFGTDTFWQGVDVPGDALTNVIIPRLPFSVPDQPLLQARLQAIRERGGNPFRDYQLPEAIIKLKQGFGRLIRTQRDRGIVVILDPRIRTKIYGTAFLDALPDCEVVDEWVGVANDSAAIEQA